MYRRAFLGELRGINEHFTDLTGREIALLGLLVALIVVVGVFPNLLFTPMQATLEQIANGAAQILALR